MATLAFLGMLPSSNPNCISNFNLDYCRFAFKGTVSRLCARANVFCFFFKRQYNCHTADGDLFTFSSNIFYFKKFFVLFKIALAAQRLIMILLLAGPSRDPKISFCSL